MKISYTMDLNQLAERMGTDSTVDHADHMRELLLETSYVDTVDVPDDEWVRMTIAAHDAVGI